VIDETTMKFSKTTLFDFRAVIAIEKHRSFRKAAQSLGVSPSTLSNSISALEADIGIRLFNRTTRSVFLSDAGQTFLQRLSPVVSELEQVLDGVAELRDRPKGVLKISVSEVAARILFPNILNEFSEKYPEIVLDLIVQENLVDIVDEGMDAGIRLKSMVPKDMISIAVGPDFFKPLVVASPDYIEKHGAPTSPHDLHQHNCIAFRFTSGKIYHWEFTDQGLFLEFKPKGNLIVNNPNIAVDAAKRGAGLAYLNDWSIRDELARGELVTVLSDYEITYEGMALYFPGHRLIPASLRALIDTLRDHKLFK